MKIECPTCQGAGKVPSGKEIIVNETARFMCQKCGQWVIVLTPFSHSATCSRCGEVYRWVVLSNSFLEMREHADAEAAIIREALIGCKEQIMLLLNSEMFSDRNINPEKLDCIQLANIALSNGAGKRLLARVKKSEQECREAAAMRKNLRCISQDITTIVNSGTI